MLTIKNPRAPRLALCLCAAAGLLAFSGCSEPGPRALLDGEQMINERRFESAVDRLILAVHHLPQNAQAQNHLGLAHHGAGQSAKAAEAYRAALELDDNLASARFNLGSLLLESGDAIGAIRELGSFVVLRPNSLEGKVRLGSAQIRAERWEDAAATFSEAFRLNSSHPEILNALGLIHLQRGESEKAKPFFSKAIEQNPRFLPAKLNLAIYEHRYSGNKRSALAAYRQFLLQHPTSPQAESVASLASALDQELNPRRAVPPSVVTAPSTTPAATSEAASAPTAGPAHMAFAKKTERATATTDPGPSARNTTQSAAPTTDASTSAQTTIDIQPITERAAAPAAATAQKLATTEEPAVAVNDTPLRPVQRNSKPPELAPAPPAAAPPPTQPVRAAVRPVEKTAVISKIPTPIVEPSKPSAPLEKPTIAKTEAPPIPTPEPAAQVKTPPVTEAPRVAPPIVKPVVIAAVPAPTEAATTEPSPSIDPARTYRPDNRPRPETDEKGFFKRLNPKRFFASKDEKPTTPLPGSSPRPPANRPPETASRPAPRPAQPPAPVAVPTAAARPSPARVQTPPPPTPPRYTYANPGPVRAGDRQAAAPVFLEGLKAHRDNRLSDAIKAYKSATVLDASLYEAQYNLGLASYRANDLAQSLRAYENALAVKPDSVSARYNFAEALKKARYTRDAANELEKLLASNPGLASAHLAAGNLYVKELGEPAQARAHYLKVLELAPNHRQAQAIRYWLSENR